MKRPITILTILLVVVLALFSLWPRGGGPIGGSVLDKLGQLIDRRDTVQLQVLERARDSLDTRVRALDAFWEGRARQFAESLAASERASQMVFRRTIRQQARADSLTQVLARAQEDDDSLPVLVALVAAKDSVIAAVTGERDGAFAFIRLLRTEIQAQDSALAGVRQSLTEALRQRDAYRKRLTMPWLKAGAVLVATVAICRSLSEPC